MAKIEVKIGAWIRGQVILSFDNRRGGIYWSDIFINSIRSAFGNHCRTDGVDSNIGPTVSMVPAAVVGFTISPLHGGAVVLLYF